MTAAVKTNPKRRVAFFLASLFLLVLFLKNSAIASSAVSDGLLLCVKVLIPSLLPLMVASELLVASGAVFRLGALLRRPAERLFGVCGDAACAVLLGMLCGFPVGTRCAVRLYEEGRLSREELARVLACSNHPSAAFLVGTVGRSLFGSARFGVLLYLTTLLSSLLLQLRLGKKRTKKEGELAPKTLILSASSAPTSPPSFSGALASAVSASALSLLSICAFVVFFSALVESLTHLCLGLSLSRNLTALLFGIFELAGGAAHAAQCTGGVAPYLCAFAVGWGGLSVHFQLLHLVGDAPFSRRCYFGAKLAQGLLNLPLLALLLWLL